MYQMMGKRKFGQLNKELQPFRLNVILVNLGCGLRMNGDGCGWYGADGMGRMVWCLGIFVRRTE